MLAIVGGTAIALAFVLFVAGAAVTVVYDEYGFHPERNARSWAALTPRYADSTVCRRCHEAEYAPWVASRHLTVVCESCHGPLAVHAAEDPDLAPVAAIVKPAAGLCAACHERAVARPAGFPQVALAEHFDQAPCIGCHDPHDAEALVPPDISHPIDRLPACNTCHEPDGLKPLPAGHVESTDDLCRFCHRRAAGSE